MNGLRPLSRELFEFYNGQPILFAVHEGVRNRDDLVTDIEANGGRVSSSLSEVDYCLLSSRHPSTHLAITYVMSQGATPMDDDWIRASLKYHKLLPWYSYRLGGQDEHEDEDDESRDLRELIKCMARHLSFSGDEDAIYEHLAMKFPHRVPSEFRALHEERKKTADTWVLSLSKQHDNIGPPTGFNDGFGGFRTGFELPTGGSRRKPVFGGNVSFREEEERAIRKLPTPASEGRGSINSSNGRGLPIRARLSTGSRANTQLSERSTSHPSFNDSIGGAIPKSSLHSSLSSQIDRSQALSMGFDPGPVFSTPGESQSTPNFTTSTPVLHSTIHTASTNKIISSSATRPPLIISIPPRNGIHATTSVSQTLSQEPPPKRKRGRPRKNPLPLAPAAMSGITSLVSSGIQSDRPANSNGNPNISQGLEWGTGANVAVRDASRVFEMVDPNSSDEESEETMEDEEDDDYQQPVLEPTWEGPLAKWKGKKRRRSEMDQSDGENDDDDDRMGSSSGRLLNKKRGRGAGVTEEDITYMIEWHGKYAKNMSLRAFWQKFASEAPVGPRRTDKAWHQLWTRYIEKKSYTQPLSNQAKHFVEGVMKKRYSEVGQDNVSLGENEGEDQLILDDRPPSGVAEDDDEENWEDAESDSTGAVSRRNQGRGVVITKEDIVIMVDWWKRYSKNMTMHDFWTKFVKESPIGQQRTVLAWHQLWNRYVEARDGTRPMKSKVALELRAVAKQHLEGMEEPNPIVDLVDQNPV